MESWLDPQIHNPTLHHCNYRHSKIEVEKQKDKEPAYAS
jgi:hypothetical protein